MQLAVLETTPLVENEVSVYNEVSVNNHIRESSAIESFPIEIINHPDWIDSVRIKSQCHEFMDIGILLKAEEPQLESLGVEVSGSRIVVSLFKSAVEGLHLRLYRPTMSNCVVAKRKGNSRLLLLHIPFLDNITDEMQKTQNDNIKEP